MGASLTESDASPSGKGCVCPSQGTLDLSDFPDLNDQPGREGKRNKAELRVTHTSGVYVSLPPLVPGWPRNIPIRKLIQ